MHIVIVLMSRQSANCKIGYGWNYLRKNAPERPFHNLYWWPTEILEALVDRGHTGHIISIDTPDFIHKHYQTNSSITYDLKPGLKVTYLHSKNPFQKILHESDAVIIRHDYPRYSEFFEGFELQNRPSSIIKSSALYGDLDWKPNSDHFSLLVNGESERKLMKKRLNRVEVFLKPAAKRFAPPTTRINKSHDILFACWDTRDLRKRFSLLLEAIYHYSKLHSKLLRIVVIGDASEHLGQINHLNQKHASIKIETPGPSK